MKNEKSKNQEAMTKLVDYLDGLGLTSDSLEVFKEIWGTKKDKSKKDEPKRTKYRYKE